MSRDIDIIIEQMRKVAPAVDVEQLKVKFATDDAEFLGKKPRKPRHPEEIAARKSRE